MRGDRAREKGRARQYFTAAEGWRSSHGLVGGDEMWLRRFRGMENLIYPELSLPYCVLCGGRRRCMRHHFLTGLLHRERQYQRAARSSSILCGPTRKDSCLQPLLLHPTPSKLPESSWLSQTSFHRILPIAPPNHLGRRSGAAIPSWNAAARHRPILACTTNVGFSSTIRNGLGWLAVGDVYLHDRTNERLC